MIHHGQTGATFLRLRDGWVTKPAELPRPKAGLEFCSAAEAAERFWSLANPHRQKLYNYIQKTLGFATDADDVFQETLLRSVRYFASYRAQSSFSTWLFAIAHNEIRKHFKRAGRPIPQDAVDRLTSPDESLDRTLIREVYRVAETLKPKPREVFFLFYDSGFTVPEIARITGLRPGNIKFILNKVRESLKRSLGGEHAR